MKFRALYFLKCRICESFIAAQRNRLECHFILETLQKRHLQELFKFILENKKPFKMYWHNSKFKNFARNPYIGL